MKLENHFFCRIVSILISIVLLLPSCTQKYYRLYPIGYDNDSEEYYIIRKYDPEIMNRLIFILKYLDYEVKIDKKGRAYIPKEVWEDKNGLWNYTNKAKSSEWVDKRKEWLDRDNKKEKD